MARGLARVPDVASRTLCSPTSLTDTAGWLVLVLIWAGAACLVVFLNAPVLLRGLVGLTFTLFVPGLTIVRFLRLTDTLLQVSLAVATSLALEVIVSFTMVYAGAWSPRVALAIVAGIGVVAAAVEVGAVQFGHLTNPATRSFTGEGNKRKEASLPPGGADREEPSSDSDVLA
jgi:hypothetical protein